MKTNYVLIDYENVQPKDLALLKDGPFRVQVFLGPTQSKIPVSLAGALQPLGSNAEYVPLEAIGSNALDFHIAYYLGILSSRDPSGFFHVISKDTGFDPLIRHLKGKGVFAHRSECIAAMPIFGARTPPERDERIAVIVADLVKRAAAKPRTREALLNTIHARFGKQLSESQLSELLAALCDRGFVRMEGATVSYSLPS